jgi:hypothetical protein
LQKWRKRPVCPHISPDEGQSRDPLSLHKYLYASSDPVNGIDPSGYDDLGEISAALSIGSTISSISNVAVTGIVSALFNGLPDAVGFGVFVAAPHSWSVAALGGVEVIYSTRFKVAVTYWFGGVEPSITTPLSVLSSGGSHQLTEVGVFAAWYWNLNDLGADVFALAGASAGAGFVGVEQAGPTQALLFGISNDLDLGVFGIYGKSWPIMHTQVGLSEGAMISQASLAEAAFTGAGIIYGGGVSNVGGLAATVINAGAVGTWVHYAYGKGQ